MNSRTLSTLSSDEIKKFFEKHTELSQSKNEHDNIVMPFIVDSAIVDDTLIVYEG